MRQNVPFCVGVFMLTAGVLPDVIAGLFRLGGVDMAGFATTWGMSTGLFLTTGGVALMCVTVVVRFVLKH